MKKNLRKYTCMKFPKNKLKTENIINSNTKTKATRLQSQAKGSWCIFMLWLKVFTGMLNHKNPRNPTSPSNHTVYFKESVPFRRNCLVFRKWRSGRCAPMISQRNQINTLLGKPVLPEEQLHSAQGKGPTRQLLCSRPLPFSS